jgi:transcriptional regulator GlxA family with amidase domain
MVLQHAGLEGAGRPARVNPLPGWRLKRVQNLVDSRLDEPLDLAALASAAGVSRMHFAAQFRAATGRQPHHYLLQKRIERSMSLMTRTPIPLAELALSVGFQSQSHFSTVFKRLTGQTPAQWRKVTAGRSSST